jgi:hypothetical protein
MGHNFDIQRVPRGLNAVVFKPRLVLLVSFLAVCLYAVVDLRLVFEERDGLFLWNLSYFTDFIGHPGSLLNWADSLLVQLCYYNWPAALVLAGAAWLLLISTIGLMNATARVAVNGTWLIPGIALFALYGAYSAHTSLLLGATLAVAAANGWVRVAAGGFVGAHLDTVLTPSPRPSGERMLRNGIPRFEPLNLRSRGGREERR